MADKTTTLKTKTNDNVYPNVIGDNRKNAFVDSSTITHHFYDKTHKVGFQIANETNIKIQNSLQKPAGLTKTKLVGVGTNGQENIEIGDNLTLVNGKLSATGGGSGGYEINILSGDYNTMTYTGTLSVNKLNILDRDGLYNVITVYDDNIGIFISTEGGYFNTVILQDGKILSDLYDLLHYSHFITMTDSSNNVVLYLTIQNTDNTKFTAYNLAPYLEGKKVLANGNLHGVVPTYITVEDRVIKIYYRTPGDSNINPTPDEYQDLTSFTITDLVTPV